jgi:tRNA-specific 2-thiouridylase
MNKKKKVLVAMSGGVDSSVAAALLKQKGYDVVGVYMMFLPGSGQKKDHQSARKSSEAASALGIEHFRLDLRKKFKSQIIDYFLSEYSRGLTPNPCVKCNAYMKFEALLEESQKIGADKIATGHYVRINQNPKTKKFCLKRGVDSAKDQSYFLYLLSQRHLSRAVMPLGSLTKDLVREEAKKWNLAAFAQTESQEICFIPEDDYIAFIKNKSPLSFKKGVIVNPNGKVLGTHEGFARFTIGQRRGLGIAASHPLYVLDINPEKNKVTAGSEKDLYTHTLMASKVHWVSDQPMTSSLRVQAQIRYNHRAQDAVVFPKTKDKVQVSFDKAQRAVTPGQSVVFYNEDVLLGGGIIIRD